VEELDAWHEAAPMKLMDEIGELKSKVELLEAEVRSLKRLLKKAKKAH
jgi:hypothetical protein